jgi:hypothetical protein
MGLLNFLKLSEVLCVRFNELRRVRNKEKTGGSERPFSRMHNFFVLASGEKWARTGTKFRPLNSKGFPDPPVRDHSMTHKVNSKSGCSG